MLSARLVTAVAFVGNVVVAADGDDQLAVTRIVDNQPYSFDELEERKRRVHRALTAQGFDMVLLHPRLRRAQGELC